MQPQVPVTNDLPICNLSPQEQENPYLVFENLYRHHDLPALYQLNTGLIRSVLVGEGFNKLPNHEQMAFICYSAEIARLIEATFLLYTRHNDVPPNPTDPAASSAIKQPYKKPIHLTEQEQKNPLMVLAEFVEDFSLPSVQQVFSTMVEICLTTENYIYNQSRARDDLLYVFKHLNRLLEAAYLLIQQQGQTKILTPDFRPFDKKCDNQ